MQTTGLGNYIAGLWISNIFADLLWTVVAMNARPIKWVAPTWSWASVEGRETIRNALEQDNSPDLILDHRNLRERQSLDVDSGDNPFKTTLVSAESFPVGEDPTGELAFARLVISAPVIEVSINGSPQKLLVFSMSTHQGSLELRPDCYGDFVDGGKKTSKLTPGSIFGSLKDRHQFICVWIGTVWKENDFFSTTYGS
jgi:hypothetical protein